MGAHGYAAGRCRAVCTGRIRGWRCCGGGPALRGAAGGQGAFTLIELLVVIGIIAVLAAIVIPVYTRAQERGRQANCISNMHAIAVAIRMYHQDYRVFPPAYDPVSGYGGVSALYQGDYLSNYKSLRCPDDQTTLEDYMALYATMETTVMEPGPPPTPATYTGPTILEWGHARYGEPWDDPVDNGRYFREHYSSYNCAPGVDPDENDDGVADVTYQLYNANGYDSEGLSLLAAPGGFGAKYPGLCNRWAPDETIVTHCPFHRDYFGGAAAWQDVVARLGGDAGLMKVAGYDWPNQPPE